MKRKMAGPPKRRRTTRRTARVLHSDGAPAVLEHVLGAGRQSIRAGVSVPISVVVADLRGFTRLSSRLKHELVVRLLDDFFSVMTDLAVTSRAMIDKPNSDSLTLLYGLPQRRGDDPVRAVRTGMEMQRAFLGLHNTWLRDTRRAAAGIGLGIGIATGPVTITKVRSLAHLQYTAIGASLNRAATLCAAAADATVLIDGMTHAAVAGELQREVTFTSVETALDSAPGDAYLCRARRARLHVVTGRPPIDPVCGTTLFSRAPMRRRIGRRVYDFCSRECAERFVRDPSAYQ